MMEEVESGKRKDQVNVKARLYSSHVVFIRATYSLSRRCKQTSPSLFGGVRSFLLIALRVSLVLNSIRIDA